MNRLAILFAMVVAMSSAQAANTVTKVQSTGSYILDTGDGVGIKGPAMIGVTSSGVPHAVLVDSSGQLMTTGGGGGGGGTVDQGTAGTSAWLVRQGGLSKSAIIRNDYSSTNVTTSAYVQLVASTADDINKLYIFDSSGKDLLIAVGAVASEVDQFQIPPGGPTPPIDLFIPAGSRISVKAVSGTASSGVLLITGLK